jgi:hypothetical protein
VREQAYDIGLTGRTATANDIQWLAAGPVQLTGMVQTRVLVLDGNTLDTLWTRPGALAGNGAVRLHVRAGGRLLAWQNGYGTGQTATWAGQRFAGAVVGGALA